MLLTLLSRSRKPMYGYQIARIIDGSKSSAPMMKQGALYPVLRSLEANGLLASSVEPSVSGPPRKYYRITPEGRATLKQWRHIWSETRQFVEDILEERDND